MANRLTGEQAAIIGAHTGVCAGPFSDVHVYAEKKLGRLIDIFEFRFANIWEELKEASRADFMAISYRKEIRACKQCGRELFSITCWRCDKPEWRSA
jgi:hypothetical protein